MNIVIDVILVAIIGACLVSGWRKGFITTVMNFASFLIAGVGAYLFYPVPADYAYANLFLPKITSIIEGSILSGGAGMTVTELFAARPQFFVDILNRFSTVDEVEKFYNSGEALTVTDISEFMAAPLARTISNILCFFLVFIVLLIVLNLITIFLDKICKLPVLKTANTFLGILLGALLGLLFAWLLSAVVAGILPSVSTAYPELLPPTTIEDSVVLRWLHSFNPLTLFK